MMALSIRKRTENLADSFARNYKRTKAINDCNCYYLRCFYGLVYMHLDLNNNMFVHFVFLVNNLCAY